MPRWIIDLTFVLLLGLTAGSFFVADGARGAGAVALILALVLLKGLLIQSVFMGLWRRPAMMGGLLSFTAALAASIGLVLTR